MDIKNVYAVYFSPVGNVRKIAVCTADSLAKGIGSEVKEIDFTLPAGREKSHAFSQGDVIVFATPVYAGRVPNKILPYVQEGFAGNGALAVPMVSYGNRSFDNALAELAGELTDHGFKVVCGCAVPSQHSFSEKLATGRPGDDDMNILRDFGTKASGIISAAGGPEDIFTPAFPGEYPAPAYYTPLQADGTPAKFLKAVPDTDREICVSCGKCAAGCPMGSIDKDDTSLVKGVCIKCSACVNGCPVKAKYFTDPQLLSHIEMLIQNYGDKRREIEIFCD